MSVNLYLTKDELSPELQQLLQSSGAAKKVAGVAMRNELIKHFRKKNGTPNKLGGQRTNFWLTVANACSAPVARGHGVMVAIRHPHVATHVYGAIITPKKAKVLTIPVAAEAHGKRARMFKGLKTVFDGYRPVGFEKDGVMLFRFAKAATIKKDPKALPESGTVYAAVTKALRILMRRQGGGNAGGKA